MAQKKQQLVQLMYWPRAEWVRKPVPLYLTMTEEYLEKNREKYEVLTEEILEGMMSMAMPGMERTPAEKSADLWAKIPDMVNRWARSQDPELLEELTELRLEANWLGAVNGVILDMEYELASADLLEEGEEGFVMTKEYLEEELDLHLG